MIEHLDLLDRQIFLFLNSLHCSLCDSVFWLISARWFWIPWYVFLIVLIFVKQKKKGFLSLLFLIIAIALADQISTQLLKELVQRFRPSRNPEISSLVHIVNDYRGGMYGFVSSHAANSFALAVFITFLFRIRWLTIIIFVWAVVVSYSRIYLGVHYPGDVICGALLGSAIGYGCLTLNGRWNPMEDSSPRTRPFKF